uniref:Serine recombinase family protein n=1 Tax=Vibrio phage P018-4 TaxID=3229728 RepID=A0AB39AJR7_9CAUD
MSRKIGYRRCSTNESKQDLSRQLLDIKLDLCFDEFASGKDERGRPVFQEMVNSVKKGDTIYFNDLSRAGRNAGQLINTINKLLDQKVTIHFITENITLSGDDSNPMQQAMSELIVNVMASMNQFFLAQQKASIKQGLESARRKGKKLGGSNEAWHETYTANRAAGKHSTTKLFKPSPQKDKLIVDIKTAISYGSPKSFVELADKLNKNKVFTLGDKPWNGRSLATFCQRNEIKL